ncbi:MAG: amidohydrolase [Jatrophihabitantaceae bacterium]
MIGGAVNATAPFAGTLCSVRTLYRNARVHSAAVPDATALLVDGEVISWIGDDASTGTDAEVRTVDLHGAFVTPAFVDAHVHATATGLALTGLDLSGAAGLAEALSRVERAARSGRGRPILGTGWDESAWPEGRPPSRAELDRASYGGSVYLSRVDAHSAAISSSLAVAVDGLAGLPGYAADGPLTGAAHDAVRTAAFGALGAGQIRDAQRAALEHAASLGIACVHEMAGPAISSADDLAGLLALAAEEPVAEVIGYWGELFGVDTALELGAIGAGGDLFCDGSLGSHTAALHEPYADRPGTSGALRFSTDDVAEHILRCIRSGLQAGFHAIGDAAVDQILDAVDLVTARIGRAGGAGHRIEHAELVRDPRRLAASGLLASVQPGFDAAWGGADGMYARRLGPARAGQLNRFGELAAVGVPLAFGSDAPVTPLGPWAAVRAAAHPSDPDAAISVRSAFAAHTRAGWRAAGRDGGVLAPGAVATFAIWRAGELGVDAPDERVARWSTDPRAAVPSLPDLAPGPELPTCVATILRGEPIFGTGLDTR